MSLSAIRQALEKALDAITPKIATEWENVTFAPPAADTPYQKVSWLAAEPQNPAFDQFTRETGYMQVLLLYPANHGSHEALARAGKIRDAFKRGNSYLKDGITVQIDRTPAILPAIIDGDRYCVPVRVRFFANVPS